MTQPRPLGGVLHLMFRWPQRSAQSRLPLPHLHPYLGFQSANQIRLMGQRMFGSHQRGSEWALVDRQSSA